MYDKDLLVALSTPLLLSKDDFLRLNDYRNKKLRTLIDIYEMDDELIKNFKERVMERYGKESE